VVRFARQLSVDYSSLFGSTVTLNAEYNGIRMLEDQDKEHWCFDRAVKTKLMGITYGHKAYVDTLQLERATWSKGLIQ
jgi:hypothetical protein